MSHTGKQPVTVFWLQSGGCGGWSMSLLNAESPDLLSALAQNNIELLWHPSLSEASSGEFIRLLDRITAGQQPLDILCLEGSVMRGPNNTGRFHMMAGTDKPMMQVIDELTQVAEHVVAVGSCAAFGGITMAGSNPGEACGLQYSGREPGGLLPAHWRDETALPVINIAGCPTHPNWVIETLVQLADGEFTPSSLDDYHRPLSYTSQLVHHGCPRNEFYEYKASAENPAELGCMMEHMGCLGTQARADCNIRLWNGNGSCLRGGYACINCTAPEFEEPAHRFGDTPKIAGIPVGLPTDMPKAWFVALASLAKAATPERLKKNATADHIKHYPSENGRKK